MDFTLLALMGQRWNWEHYSSYISTLPLAPETHALLKWIASYYKKNPSITELNKDELITYMRLKNCPEEALAIANATLNAMPKLTPELQAVYSSAMRQNIVATAMRKDLESFDNDTLDLEETYPALFEDFTTGDAEKSWETDIQTAIQNEMDDHGWNLDCLPFGDKLRGLRKGHSILIAAPTDMGKTWLLCRVAVHLLKQMLQEHKEELKTNPGAQLRPILFATNEQAADIILTRLVRTVLNKPLEELAKMQDVSERYHKIIPQDAIRVQNVHGQSAQQVAALAAKYNAQVLITDMTQRCSWSGGYGTEHQDLEAVWNYFREQAILKDFLHIGTSQISIEGTDQLFPPLTALKQSKTGIQNTVDLAIYVGSRIGTEPMYERLRGISTPKNKLQRNKAPRYNCVEVMIDFEHNEWR